MASYVVDENTFEKPSSRPTDVDDVLKDLTISNVSALNLAHSQQLTSTSEDQGTKKDTKFDRDFVKHLDGMEHIHGISSHSRCFNYMDPVGDDD